MTTQIPKLEKQEEMWITKLSKQDSEVQYRAGPHPADKIAWTSETYNHKLFSDKTFDDCDHFEFEFLDRKGKSDFRIAEADKFRQAEIFYFAPPNTDNALSVQYVDNSTFRFVDAPFEYGLHRIVGLTNKEQ